MDYVVIPVRPTAPVSPLSILVAYVPRRTLRRGIDARPAGATAPVVMQSAGDAAVFSALV